MQAEGIKQLAAALHTWASKILGSDLSSGRSIVCGKERGLLREADVGMKRGWATGRQQVTPIGSYKASQYLSLFSCCDDVQCEKVSKTNTPLRDSRFLSSVFLGTTHSMFSLLWAHLSV